MQDIDKLELVARKVFLGSSLFALTFVATLFVSSSLLPVGDSKAESTLSAGMDVSVGEVMSVSLEPSVGLNITPSTEGTFNSTSTTVRVSTNTQGYRIYISDNDGNTALSHTDSSINDKIDSLTAAASAANNGTAFPVNSWGYSLDGTTYNGITSDYTVIKETNSLMETPYEDTTVYFGAKADMTLTAGAYTNSITFTVSSANVYKPKPYIADAKTMQSVTVDQIKNTKPGVTVALEDERDGKMYFVTKEADGNLWMTQNLDLDLELDGNKIITRKNGQAVEITKDNTNITTDTWTTTQNNLGKWNDSTDIGTHNPGNKCQAGGTATEFTDCSTTSGSANHEHVGNYYTWTAATAGSTILSGNAATDICPAGWHLPTGDTSGEFKTLLVGHYLTSGSNRDEELFNAPFWLLRTGRYDHVVINFQGDYGVYWSSTANSTSNAYRLLLHSDSVVPGTYYNDKNFGYTIRCMKEGKESLKTAKSMQKVTQEMVDNTPTGETVALEDERDGKWYYVTKEADGHVWMTQNLDLDLHVNDCDNTHQTTLATGTMGTCKNGTFVPFTDKNTDISGDNWTIVSDGTEDNAGYDTQTATGTQWNQFGSNNGTNYTTGKDNAYEVRSYDPGDKCRTYSTRTGTDPESNTTSGCTSSLAGADHDHVGNYYNWPAATAGTGTFDDKTQYANVEDSICPSGWKLPTGHQSNTANNEWNALLNKVNSAIPFTTGYISITDPIMASLMNDNGVDSSSIWLTRAGYYYYSNGSMNYLGTYGYYWSRSVYSGNYAYYLYFSSGAVRPGTYNDSKGRGFSVRCRL